MRVSEFRIPAARLRCSCGRTVESFDMRPVRGRVAKLICSGCHRDLASIEITIEQQDAYE
jgi:hypothetical protein